jgi:hypothetical protein
MFNEFQRGVTETGLIVLRVVHCHSCGWIISTVSQMLCPNGHVMSVCGLTESELMESVSMWN